MRAGLPILVLLSCAACGTGRLIPTDGGSATGATNTSTESETGQNSDPSESGSSGTDDETGIAEDIPGPVPCDSFLQDCAEGEKCVPWSPSGGIWDASKCVPVLGEQAMGEPCTYDGIIPATDNCDATSFCFDTQDVDGELIGTCHAFCTGTSLMPECPEGQQCIQNSGPVTLCFPMCDPVLQDCGGGEGCYWSGTNFICTEPVNPPGFPPGAACRFTTECEIGSICLDAAVIPNCNGMGCCGAFCDLGLGDMQCAAVPGTSCVAFFEGGMAPEGYDHVGVCIIPP